MTTASTPAALTDADGRILVNQGLDTNVFVEAGAGSGKTHELVGRIVALVDDGVELKSLAAITFTDKAAGELRERVRRRLTNGPDTDLRRRALDQLDTAPIGTIHAFAARIIGEHPIEAGVPPLITVIDELRSRIAFDRRWERARRQLFADPDAATALRVLLAVGVTLDQLRTVASGLDDNWDRLASHPPQRRPIPTLDIGPILHRAEEMLAQESSCRDRSDKLLDAFTKVATWYQQLDNAQCADNLSLSLEVLRQVPTTGFARKGTKKNWAIDVETVRQSFQDLADDVDNLIQSLTVPAVDTVGAIIAAELLAAAQERRRSGELEYHDLLVHARDLMVGDDKAAVQTALHQRYRCMMLDEFQDTDPIQAEIAVRIAAEGGCGLDGWESLPVPPGRLFVVGDPKQSIYRFRRADIATYLQAKERAEADAGSAIAELRTNFRSTDALLEWINGTFGRLIAADGSRQPAYSRLVPDPARPGWQQAHGPAVSVLGRQNGDDATSGKGVADVVREKEAADVASVIALATGRSAEPGWQKQSSRGAGFSQSAIELRDICILLPTRTALPAIEDALDAAGIEYRAEASSLVYSTQEVIDLLLTLRALANTADEAALVLSLRTPLFGCGDDDLFGWKLAGGTWNIFAPVPEAARESTVARALQYLAAVARELPVLRPAALLDRLVTDRRILEAATDTPRYREVWRRLRFVIDQARAWTEATHGGLRDYLQWTTAQQEDGSRVKEAVVPETDAQAVRIMTIHASKGLEFPMVVLGGAGGSRNNRAVPVMWDVAGRPQLRFLTGIESAGYAQAADAEKDFDEAERRRLLYVACTRAESHLVVSLYSSSRTSLSAMLCSVDDPEHALAVVLPEDVTAGAKAAGAGAAARVAPVPDFESWQATSASWRRAAAIRSSIPVTDIAEAAGSGLTADHGLGTSVQYTGPDDEGLPPALVGTPGEHGADFGTAVHRLLQLSDLQEGPDFAGLAADTALRFGLQDAAGLEQRARSALGSLPVKRAATRGHWLELPVVTPSGNVVVEGVIDLMYREDDGSLVIVDFKTDISVSAATLAVYWAQLTTYAEIIQRVTGQTVSELALIFCRRGKAEVRTRART